MPTPTPGDERIEKTVVFADNDPILFEAIPELLRTKGFEVHSTRDGLETLETIRRLKPNYVILDIVMPKIDGSRVCWLMRQDATLRHTPVIAFSALSPEQIRRFPELSADAYVAKGPLAVVAKNLLAAIKYLDERGTGDLEGGIFGYEGFQSRRLISEMLGLKRYWETLVRVFESGVLGLDEDGRVLLANPAATGLFGRSETRIIGESLAALFSAPDRRTIQQAIGELKKTRLPEDRQLESSVGEQRVRLRLSSIVEDGACSGVLAILEPMPPRTKR
jgi:PAS domain S-box-containing protein